MLTIELHQKHLSKLYIDKQFRLNNDFKEGDEAPLAHRQVRVFPDWYKPYSFNYTSDGYMLLFFGIIGIFSYSYMNDILEQKGRKSRKIFESKLKTNVEKLKEIRWA